jgi:nitrogenase molybdenum-iron protein alpha/beta subunit
MSRVLLSLPPLSPDYSGVASVLHDLRALTILHDASGCTGTYTGYDEPRWFGSESPVFCSGLREMDAVLGDDEKLLDKMGAALKDRAAPFAAVVGSPVPTLIGFDFEGFAALAEKRLGIPVLGFPAAGFSYYDKGQKEAYLTLANRFLDPSAEKRRKRVNLLGASALDGFSDFVIDRLLGMLQNAGLEAGAVWGARSGLSELAQSGNAGANWVLTAAALPLARLLQERFGTPFVTGLPIGRGETERIFDFLKNPKARKYAISVPKPPREPHVEGAVKDPRILISGGAVFCKSLRACLFRRETEGIGLPPAT